MDCAEGNAVATNKGKGKVEVKLRLRSSVKVQNSKLS